MSGVEELPPLPFHLEVRWRNLGPSSQPNFESLLGVYELQKIGYRDHHFWVQISRWDGSSPTGITISDPIGERPCIYWYGDTLQKEGWYLTNRVDYGSGIAFAYQDESRPRFPPMNGWMAIGWLSNYACDDLCVLPFVRNSIDQAKHLVDQPVMEGHSSCSSRTISNDTTLVETPKSFHDLRLVQTSDMRLQKQLQQAAFDSDRFKCDLQISQAEICELQIELRQASIDSERFKSKFQASLVEIGELQRQLRGASIESDRFKQELKFSQSEIATVRSELDNATMRSNKLYDELKFGIQSMEEFVSELNACQAEVVAKDGKLKEATERMLEMQAEFSNLQLQMDALTQNHASEEQKRSKELDAKLFAREKMLAELPAASEELQVPLADLPSWFESKFYSAEVDPTHNAIPGFEMQTELQTPMQLQETSSEYSSRTSLTQSLIGAPSSTIAHQSRVGSVCPRQSPIIGTSYSAAKPREVVIVNNSKDLCENASVPIPIGLPGPTISKPSRLQNSSGYARNVVMHRGRSPRLAETQRLVLAPNATCSAQVVPCIASQSVRLRPQS